MLTTQMNLLHQIEENFRELLKFETRTGDNSLKNHTENTSSWITLIGKNIQNEILDCIRSVIKLHIIKNANMAGFYSIIFDETTDIVLNN